MSPLLQDIANQVRTLSDEDKNFLLEELLDQLGSHNPEIDKAWENEVYARVRADEEGKLETYSYEEVMAKYRSN